MIPIGIQAPLDLEGGGGGHCDLHAWKITQFPNVFVGLHTHPPGLYTSNVTLYFSHGL